MAYKRYWIRHVLPDFVILTLNYSLDFDPMIFIINVNHSTNNKTNNYRLCDYIK